MEKTSEDEDTGSSKTVFLIVSFLKQFSICFPPNSVLKIKDNHIWSRILKTFQHIKSKAKRPPLFHICQYER